MRLKSSLLYTSVIAVYLGLVLAVSAMAGDTRSPYWNISLVTSYATFEPGVSDYLCCGGKLNDNGFSVANNFLPQKSWVQFLKWDGKKLRRCNAVVNDHTGSRYTFEMSYALSLCVGAPPQPCRCAWLTWSTLISWRRL